MKRILPILFLTLLAQSAPFQQQGAATSTIEGTVVRIGTGEVLSKASVELVRVGASGKPDNHNGIRWAVLLSQHRSGNLSPAFAARRLLERRVWAALGGWSGPDADHRPRVAPSRCAPGDDTGRRHCGTASSAAMAGRLRAPEFAR